METKVEDKIIELLERYPVLKPCETDIRKTYSILESAYEKKGKLLIGGNGGSSSDADHIVGELMKGFCLKRAITPDIKEKILNMNNEWTADLCEKLQGALPAISLNVHNSLNTAYLNDVDAQLIMAQELFGYAVEGDVFLGISTSGNSKNVLYAATLAKALGLKVIGLTGNTGGQLKELADVSIVVPESATFKIQELHLPIYHCLCLMLEERFFGEK